MVVCKGNKQLIYVRVVDPVHEADTWALIGVIIWELDVDFPESAFVWCFLSLVLFVLCLFSASSEGGGGGR